jgi:hypothetical protein
MNPKLINLECGIRLKNQNIASTLSLHSDDVLQTQGHEAGGFKHDAPDTDPSTWETWAGEVEAKLCWLNDQIDPAQFRTPNMHLMEENFTNHVKQVVSETLKDFQEYAQHLHQQNMERVAETVGVLLLNESQNLHSFCISEGTHIFFYISHDEFRNRKCLEQHPNCTQSVIPKFHRLLVIWILVSTPSCDHRSEA